jgi:hypothetical protein
VEQLASTVRAAESSAETAAEAQRRARATARELSVVMRHTARTLEKSATLADEHALRRERAGNHEGAEKERHAAARARDAATRARTYATRWDQTGER